MKRKYLVYVTRDKMKKIRVVYLVKILEVLLPIHLNGTEIVLATKIVT